MKREKHSSGFPSETFNCTQCFFLSWDSPQVAAPKEALEVGRNDNAVIALLAASLAWRTGKRHAPATSL